MLSIQWIKHNGALLDARRAQLPETESVEVTANGQNEGLAEIMVGKISNSKWEGTDLFTINVRARGDLLSSVEPRLTIYGKDSEFISSAVLGHRSNFKEGHIASEYVGDFRVNPAHSEFSHCTILCYNAAKTKGTLYKIPLKFFIK